MPEVVRVRMSILDIWAQWNGRLLRSLQRRGLTETIKLAAALAKQIVSDRWILYRSERFGQQLAVDTAGERVLSDLWTLWLNHRFDRRFGVDTAGIIKLPELQSDPRFKYSYDYWPTPRSPFYRVLRQLNVDYGKFVFIDFGCGKGKALLLAAELPFKQIIGVELSSKFVQLAEDNLRTYRGKPRKCNAIQLACMDAIEYRIPDEPAIFYFYNPFQPEVMSTVLENIRNSLVAAPREAYVVYLYPIHRSLLDESGFLTAVKNTSWYAIYKASGV